MRKTTAMTALAGALAFSVATIVSAETVLKASHQWPGGKGDIRDEMVRVLERKAEGAGVDLDIRIYPGESLFKAKEQWSALTKGRLDIAAFPLDYASGRHPAFSATLMPGLVRNHERAKRLNDSRFMDMIKKKINDAGVIVLADAWLAGAFASKQNCITGPDSIDGQVTRAAGPAFERMLAAAGASITSMASSEIYTAMQTGVLDAANTSSGSFLSYRLYEQVSCLTAPGENALWMMYEPILISKRSWDRLSESQQKALRSAGEAAEQYFADKAAALDQEMVKTFRDQGVKVIKMSRDDFDAWIKVAEDSAYAHFAEEVRNGEELINAARDVK